MTKMNLKFKNSQKGQVFPLMVISLSIVLFSTLALIGGSQLYYSTSDYGVDTDKAISLAEAGLDKALASLNKSGGFYTGETETFLGDGSYSVVLTTKEGDTKIITSTGYIPNKSNPKVKRSVKIQATKGIGVAFVYGVQVGEGGLQLGNSNIITGSVYSNGSISAGNGNEISGDVWVAGGQQPDPDQQTDCSGSNCADYIFGKRVGSEDRLDIAQSFKPSLTQSINKVALKLKKIGNPSDVSVRILADSGGVPDKNAVLTSGTLYSSLVTSSYGWIDVAFTTSPVLTQDITYWLLIDSSSDNSNYWSIHNDTAQSYTRGLPKWSPKWDHGSPTWTNINGDLSFKTFIGGVPTSVRSGANKMEIGGDIHANTIENVEVAKDAYYQSITTSEVVGNSYPNSADPAPKVFPISDSNITEWKNKAFENGDESIGDINGCVAVLNSSRIVGNVTLDSSCEVTVTSPVHITGDLNLNSGNQIKLAPSYAGASGVIVVDGRVIMNSNNKFLGTGVGSSLLMVLSTYDSRSNGVAAIVMNSQGNTGVFYANLGVIEPGTNNQFKELTAWGIRLINSSNITYETGLSSTIFSSGPTGSYSLVKGTYIIE